MKQKNLIKKITKGQEEGETNSCGLVTYGGRNETVSQPRDENTLVKSRKSVQLDLTTRQASLLLVSSLCFWTTLFVVFTWTRLATHHSRLLNRGNGTRLGLVGKFS